MKQRPVYLDLPRIRLPLPGIVSILHRASGALLVLAGIPLLLYAVSRSLASPEAYAAMKSSFSHPVAKLVLVVLLWAYLHHFRAGIRYLLLDIHRGIELEPARRSSAAVMVFEPGADADPRSAAVVTRRHAVGAHYGLMDWLVQRLSAVVMTVYTVLLLAIVLWNGGIDDALWTELFAHGGFSSLRSCSWWRSSTTPGSAYATS